MQCSQGLKRKAILVNPLRTGNPKTGTSANSAAFHQGLHCLLKQNQSSEKEILYFLEIITCDPSIYIMDYPHLTVSNIMENSIDPKRVNEGLDIDNKFIAFNVASTLGVITSIRLRLKIMLESCACILTVLFYNAYAISLFVLIPYVPVNNFSVMSDRSSWVEPVLSRGYSVLLEDTTQCLRWGLNPQPFNLE